MKTLRSFLLVGLLAASCTDGAAQHPIRFATGDAPYKEAFDAIAAEYEQLHPDVDVIIQVVPGDTYATWIRTAVAGGEQTSPDIFSTNYAKSFYQSGKSIPLNSYLDAVNPYTGKKWRESFYPEHLQMVRAVNDYPGVPLNYIDIAVFYNKDLFANAGVQPPRNWAELLEVSAKLRASGTIPMAMPADAESTWSLSFGWLVRVMSDAYQYDRIEFIRARPGDFSYVPEVDGVYVADKNNPIADMMLNLPMERYLQSILDGDVAMDSPAMGALYTRIKEFSQYWQRGFGGSSFNSCYQLFITQRAAMMMHHSGAVLGLKYDLDQINAANRFDWGVFPVPSVENDPYAQIPFRGVGAPIPVYGIIRKSKEQQDRVADFLMYLTTPQSGRRILEVMVEGQRAIVGPFAIKDVPLPPGLDDKFAPFLGRGCDRMGVRGIYDEQQVTWRWVILTQDYMGDAISLEDYLDQYQRVTIEAIPRLIRANELDMDPATRDNNGPLIIEIEDIFKRLGKVAAPPATTEAMRQSVSEEIGSVGFPLVAKPAAGIDLLVDRTIPIVFVDSPAGFEATSAKAHEIAKAAGYQYLSVVQVGSQPLRYKTFNFRPTVDEVVARLSGKRYTTEQLHAIFVD